MPEVTVARKPILVSDAELNLIVAGLRVFQSHRCQVLVQDVADAFAVNLDSLDHDIDALCDHLNFD